MRTLTLPGMEPPGAVGPQPPDPGDAALAAGLPRGLRLGTSSWSFPGWAGLVYAGRHSRERLARDGLAAYAAHPLLRAVGLDRSYYGPVPPAALRGYADAVPEDFRFVCKAHEHCTWDRFPAHRRFGALAGRANPRFLDPAYAAQAVVAPLAAALGVRLGAVVFQFPPQSGARMGDPGRFADALAGMLEGLAAEVPVAVELRSPHLMGEAYAEALGSTGASHCLGVHPATPHAQAQARLAAALPGRALVVRWNLGHGRRYAAARERYAPFDRMVDPDPATRRCIAAACLDAVGSGREALVVINNKAEGSAPLSVRALAGAVAGAPRDAGAQAR